LTVLIFTAPSVLLVILKTAESLGCIALVSYLPVKATSNGASLSSQLSPTFLPP
jgi:hypothetical protein